MVVGSESPKAPPAPPENVSDPRTVHSVGLLLGKISEVNSFKHELKSVRHATTIRVSLHDALARHVLPWYLFDLLLTVLTSKISEATIFCFVTLCLIAKYTRNELLQFVCFAMAAIGYITAVGTANIRILLLNLGEFEQIFLMLQVIRCSISLMITADYDTTSRIYNIVLLIGSTSLLSIVDALVASRRVRLGISMLLLVEYGVLLNQSVFKLWYKQTDISYLIGETEVKVDWSAQMNASLVTMMVFVFKDLLWLLLRPGQAKYLHKPIIFEWYTPQYTEKGGLVSHKTGILDTTDKLASPTPPASPTTSAFSGSMDRPLGTHLNKEEFVLALSQLGLTASRAEVLFDMVAEGSAKIGAQQFQSRWGQLTNDGDKRSKATRQLIHTLNKACDGDADRVWEVIVLMARALMAVRLVQRVFRLRMARRKYVEAVTAMRLSRPRQSRDLQKFHATFRRGSRSSVSGSGRSSMRSMDCAQTEAGCPRTPSKAPGPGTASASGLIDPSPAKEDLQRPASPGPPAVEEARGGSKASEDTCGGSEAAHSISMGAAAESNAAHDVFLAIEQIISPLVVFRRPSSGAGTGEAPIGQAAADAAV